MNKIGIALFTLVILFFSEVSFSHHFNPYLKGQAAVCKGSPKIVTFNVAFKEGGWALDPKKPSKQIGAWLFNGTLPGEVFEACQGDTLVYRAINDGAMEHGLDPHAINADATIFGGMKRGETRDIKGIADVPGIFMYHCAAGIQTDLHINMGMGSTTIVYPNPKVRKMKKAAVELAVIIGATPEGLYFFNGEVKHEPIEIPKGKLVRLYIQSVAHGHNTIHVIGANNTAFYAGWDPELKKFISLGQMQGYSLTNGNGVIVEFTPKTSGKRILVDHDKLDLLGKGFLFPFITP